MKLLIAGGAGMLGSDISRIADRNKLEYVALGHNELDVTDPCAVTTAIEKHKPQTVFNCAAYTDVDGAESNRDAARLVNEIGAKNLAFTTAEAGVRLIHISTDYVFAGDRTAPYVESDQTSPLSVYGATKLAGEQAVLAASPEHLVVRSSWLFGRSGKNFVETMLTLGRQRDEVAVVDDQVGCPTFTGHLAQRLIDLLTVNIQGVLHLAAADSCSWNGFAQEIFKQANVPCKVIPTTTAQIARPAPRPAYSVLRSERASVKPLPSWQNGLADYLRER